MSQSTALESKDCRTRTGMYYIEGARLSPYYALQYLLGCGFSREQGIEYLNSLGEI